VILAKAAGCSWTTTKELLRMFAANRDLSQQELDQTSASFEKLSLETARHIIKFCDGRTTLPTTKRRSAAAASAESVLHNA
jgi:hypothetical protein